MNPKIKLYLSALTVKYPSIREIWLMGSRVNGTARSDSDWDFMAFADRNTFDCLKNDSNFHDENIDLLMVWNTVTGEFSKPWGRKKSGSLLRWKWTAGLNRKATYTSEKFIPDGFREGKYKTGDVRTETLQAIKVWPEEY